MPARQLSQLQDIFISHVTLSLRTAIVVGRFLNELRVEMQQYGFTVCDPTYSEVRDFAFALPAMATSLKCKPYNDALARGATVLLLLLLEKKGLGPFADLRSLDRLTERQFITWAYSLCSASYHRSHTVEVDLSFEGLVRKIRKTERDADLRNDDYPLPGKELLLLKGGFIQFTASSLVRSASAEAAQYLGDLLEEFRKGNAPRDPLFVVEWLTTRLREIIEKPKLSDYDIFALRHTISFLYQLKMARAKIDTYRVNRWVLQLLHDPTSNICIFVDDLGEAVEFGWFRPRMLI